MKPLKLDDATVLDMVRALIEYECRTEGGALADGVLTLPALRPLVERYEALRAAERRMYRDTFEAHRLRIAMLGETTPERAILRREMDVAAGSLALSFGHAALRQGNSWECPRCGMSGSTHVAPSGALFDTCCTLPLKQRTRDRITDAAQRFGLTEATLAHGEEMLSATPQRELMTAQGFAKPAAHPLTRRVAAAIEKFEATAIDFDPDGEILRHLRAERAHFVPNLAWVSPPCQHYAGPLGPQPPTIAEEGAYMARGLFTVIPPGPAGHETFTEEPKADGLSVIRCACGRGFGTDQAFRAHLADEHTVRAADVQFPHGQCEKCGRPLDSERECRGGCSQPGGAS